MMDVFTGVVVPIASAVGGCIITMYVVRSEKQREDREQRKKILGLVLKEIDLNLGVKKGYHSRRLRTGNMILENPIFGVDDYERIIELTFESMRVFDQMQLAIDTLSTSHSTLMTNVGAPTLLNTILFEVQKAFGKETTVETAATSSINHIETQIAEDMSRIKSVLEMLRREIRVALDDLEKPINVGDRVKRIIKLNKN